MTDLAEMVSDLENDPMIGRLVHTLPGVYLFARWTASYDDVVAAYAHRQASRTSARRDIEPTTDTRR